jgi:hypothetical protein
LPVAGLQAFGEMHANTYTYSGGSAALRHRPDFNLALCADSALQYPDPRYEVAIATARQPDIMKRFEEMGFDYVGSSPADGDKRLEAERDKWRDVIRRANIRVDL